MSSMTLRSTISRRQKACDSLVLYRSKRFPYGMVWKRKQEILRSCKTDRAESERSTIPFAKAIHKYLNNIRSIIALFPCPRISIVDLETILSKQVFECFHTVMRHRHALLDTLQGIAQSCDITEPVHILEVLHTLPCAFHGGVNEHRP